MITEEAGKSEICRTNQQARNPGKNWHYSLNLKTEWRQNFLFPGNLDIFLLRLYLIGRGLLTLRRIICFIQSIDLNINRPLKHTSMRYVVWCLNKYGAVALAKMTHKIHYQSLTARLTTYIIFLIEAINNSAGTAGINWDCL